MKIIMTLLTLLLITSQTGTLRREVEALERIGKNARANQARMGEWYR